MTDLEALREKYLAMRRLRLENDRGLPVRREELRALSRRFPGVLAEIDRISMELLEARIAELDAAIANGSEPPLWARAWILVHARLRGALSIKMWLRGEKRIDDALRARFRAVRWSEEARAFEDRLQEIATPPAGRITELVHREVADALGVRLEDMRTLLMPRPSS